MRARLAFPQDPMIDSAVLTESIRLLWLIPLAIGLLMLVRCVGTELTSSGCCYAHIPGTSAIVMIERLVRGLQSQPFETLRRFATGFRLCRQRGAGRKTSYAPGNE
jgi:hypothetical protein